MYFGVATHDSSLFSSNHLILSMDDKLWQIGNNKCTTVNIENDNEQIININCQGYVNIQHKQLL